MTWQVLVAALVGAALGYGGGRLAPRWMEKPPQAWAIYALAGVNGLLTGLLAWRYGLSAYFWHQFIFLAILSLASFVDLHDRIIPNELVLFGLGAGLLLMLLSPYAEKGWLQAMGGGGAGFLFLLLLALLVPGGMGMGDVKLAAVMGLFMGFPWIGMGLLLSFLIGGLVSAGMLVARRVGRKQHIPFGPFLALGSILTVIYGGPIWAWYMGF